MSRPLHGVPARVDTNVDKIAPMSPQVLSQTMSPVGSLLAVPPVAPEPAYIASREAGLIITREVLAEFHLVEDADLSDLHEQSLSQVSDSALVTVNCFLDRILHNVLASSRSLSLASLRTAVTEVLKPRLASEAIGGADEELMDCIGEDDEVDMFEDPTEGLDGSFDLDLVWKRARLRCMVYTRLGDMEEEDEERFIEENALDGYMDERRTSRNSGLVSPPVAIWLTAILEFIGENALMIASQHAYRRCENKYGRGLAGQPLHPSVVTVGDGDLEKIALNPTLGRLWRAWRKPLKSPRSSISRAMSVESMRHRRGDSRSSLGFARKISIEEMNGQRDRPLEQDPAVIHETPRNDSLAEEPEAEEESKDIEPEVVSEELEPADIPLPLSQYDVDEIEVPGYNPMPDWEGREEDVFMKSRRPISVALPGSSDAVTALETAPLKGPRHMRSQSLPGARRPSAYTLFDEERPTVAEVLSTGTAARTSVDDRPISDVSQDEVFKSLTRPADYQTPGEEAARDKRKSTRRNRASFVPPADRKSGVSEYGVEFDRSDYRVDPNEPPPILTTIMSPHVTAATPTAIPGTPVDTPVRSGLRSNRPVSLAIRSPGKLAAPERKTTGEISPLGEGEYLDSGEVSPLEPSDDEGSVSIAGLKDAKEHMGLDPSEHSAPSSDDVYDDAEEQTVSPLSPPEAPLSVPARTWIEPAVPQPRREVVPVAASPAVATRPRQDDAMVRQPSDERRREARDSALSSPRPVPVEKDNLPDIPKAEQINKLAAAAKAHTNVAVPQPERIFRSMSKDMTDVGPSQTTSQVTSPAAVVPGAQTSVSTLAAPSLMQAAVPGPEPSPEPVLKTTNPAAATRIHRKELSQDARPVPVPQDARNVYQETRAHSQEARRQYPEPKTQPQEQRGQYQEVRSHSQEARSQHRDLQSQTENQISSQNVGVTPLHLKQSSVGETAIAPPTSKLLERRRQLPQVDTATPERAAVQRLSPTSPEEVVKVAPPRSVPEQMFSVATPPMPRESTPPVARRPASRKTSKSGEDVFGHKATKSRGSSHERSKEFEQLIDSGETIQYTLTPQNIRSYQAAEAAAESVAMQPSNSRDRARGLSLTGGFGGKARSNTATQQAPAPAPPVAASNVPGTKGFVGFPVRRPAAATPSTSFGIMQGKKSGLAPREAKADMSSSTRDFADFLRTTGPSEGGDFYSAPQKVVRGPVPVRNADIQAKPQTAGLPSGMRSPTSSGFSGSRNSTSTAGGSKRKGPKLLARDPQTNDKSTSDLIDFIREGPPAESGAHRIPRTNAPFRTTMDSDDMRNGLNSNPPHANGHSRYAPSINSTQESFKTASGISSSNSHTGLLAASRANATIPMGGLAEEPQMPVRKSRKPRDPYAIDISDEEDEYGDDDQMGSGRGGHQREESLVEFLQSQLPPANTNASTKVSSLGRPIGNGPGMARPKPQARAAGGSMRSETNDLADFFKNSAPPGGGMGMGSHASAQSITKEKKGLGGMFKRARG